ncbi:MAG TPA: hypothetical protein VEC37_12110 [Bacillota bacterium]|nr:hypothetical protein [Bacillota bacterium]
MFTIKRIKLLGLILAVSFTFGGCILFPDDDNNQQSPLKRFFAPQGTPTATPTATPTVSPTPTVTITPTTTPTLAPTPSPTAAVRPMIQKVAP